MELDLMHQPQETVNEPSSRSKDKRPPNITVPKPSPSSHRWRECKVIGKNISIRSYGAACAFRNRLYLYGGYQILMGALQDFYSIGLQESETTFNWEQILPQTPIHPANRSKHALLCTDSHIYLVGGLLLNNSASNHIYQYDPDTHIWTLLQPEGQLLPPLQSFGAVAVKTNGEEKIIIAFGFNESTATPSNAVYEYNIQKNKLSVLSVGTEANSKDVPEPRTGCAVATDGLNLYIFGGKNEFTRYNDLWSFSLTDYKFTRLKDDGEVPAVRNGHSMNYYDGKLYVFGGIHDITWQLDDLHIYNIKSNHWSTLEQDSPRKIEKKGNRTPAEGEKHEKSAKKKGWYETMGSSALHRAPSPLSIKHNYSHNFVEEGTHNNDSSPGRMLEEQKKKLFMHKKAEMLRNFDVSSQQKSKYIALETSSQAMKISLDVIGNPDPKLRVPQDRLTDFGKQSASKFLGPLQNNTNIVIGKKPCARDGHCAVLMGQTLVIIGGDRHQMSFNDIYKLDLSLANKEVSDN